MLRPRGATISMQEENSAEIMQAQPLGKRLNTNELKNIFTSALKEHPRGKCDPKYACVVCHFGGTLNFEYLVICI